MSPGAGLSTWRTSRALRLLSYNIQAGVETRRYRDYLTRSWKHVLPHRERLRNLNRIAAVLGEYDLVGLQEVDSGSLRSGFVDQTEYLAQISGFPYSYKQVNRRLGKFAQHSNAILSRLRPSSIFEYKLPGVPGRGAMLVQFGSADHGLSVCVMHLSLGRRARLRQLAYVEELLWGLPHLIVMGDFNCECDSKPLRRLIAALDLKEPSCGLKTFPSWRPRRDLDHILVSSPFSVNEVRVLEYPFSDHLPLSMEVAVPPEMHFGEAPSPRLAVVAHSSR